MTPRRKGRRALERIIKVLVCAGIGWVVSQVAADELEALEVHKKAATLIGGLL
jgi:hypothetical protein